MVLPQPRTTRTDTLLPDTALLRSRRAAKVATRMRVGGVAGRTITLRVRFADFTTITRSRTLTEATDVTREIHATATRLYDALGLQRARVRLVGVRVEGLVPRSTVQRQLVLGEREHGWSAEIGRAHVCTHVTNANLVCSL